MALPDTIKLEAATSRTSGFSTTTIADGATGTGSAIANQTNLDKYLTADFYYTYSVNPTASKTVKVYLVYAVDGTNYEDVDDNTNLAAVFSPAADTDNHRVVLLRNWPVLPFAFKLVVVNVDTAQTITLTVNAYTHNEAIVD